jgi:hypothetical protein
MKAQPEFQLQKMIAQYLRTAHKGVHFLSDVRAALRLTIPQQVRAKSIQADNFACPDMVIFEPRLPHYCGMFLELKAESPFKRDGMLKKDNHIQRQYSDILSLRIKHYHADFYWDFEVARSAIDAYLK